MIEGFLEARIRAIREQIAEKRAVLDLEIAGGDRVRRDFAKGEVSAWKNMEAILDLVTGDASIVTLEHYNVYRQTFQNLILDTGALYSRDPERRVASGQLPLPVNPNLTA